MAVKNMDATRNASTVVRPTGIDAGVVGVGGTTCEMLASLEVIWSVVATWLVAATVVAGGAEFVSCAVLVEANAVEVVACVAAEVAVDDATWLVVCCAEVATGAEDCAVVMAALAVGVGTAMAGGDPQAASAIPRQPLVIQAERLRACMVHCSPTPRGLVDGRPCWTASRGAGTTSPRLATRRARVPLELP